MAKLRVIKISTKKMGMLLESLRYAGLICDLQDDYNENGEAFYTFRINAPKGVKESTWSEMNSKRMKSFGIKSEVN